MHDRIPVTLVVNGRSHDLEIEPRETLADVLRDRLALTGLKVSCDAQVCGACTVLVDGLPVSGCTFLAADADGRRVRTVEGLAVDGELSDRGLTLRATDSMNNVATAHVDPPTRQR